MLTPDYKNGLTTLSRFFGTKLLILKVKKTKIFLFYKKISVN